MATISATSPSSSITRAALAHKLSPRVASPVAIGMSTMAKRGKVMCSMEKKPSAEENRSNMSMGASLVAAACAATMSSPAMALVDERLTTKGTGLPFGLSNNLLVWILLGVFGLIWHFILFTLPPLTRMRSLDCRYKPNLISVSCNFIGNIMFKGM